MIVKGSLPITEVFSAGKQDFKQPQLWVQQIMTFRANYLSFQPSF